MSVPVAIDQTNVQRERYEQYSRTVQSQLSQSNDPAVQLYERLMELPLNIAVQKNSPPRCMRLNQPGDFFHLFARENMLELVTVLCFISAHSAEFKSELWEACLSRGCTMAELYGTGVVQRGQLRLPDFEEAEPRKAYNFVHRLDTDNPRLDVAAPTFAVRFEAKGLAELVNYRN